MTLGLTLYKIATSILSLFYGVILRRRVKIGKEDPSRVNERRAQPLIQNPGGLVFWLHGASVGECIILIELGKHLQKNHPGALLLFTSQTQTSAQIIRNNLPDRALHQMAPIDTPVNAKRFIQHWAPTLAVIAEGDIWPNLILAAKNNQTKLALVNARMTESSIGGWRRWKTTAKKVIGSFDVILAADDNTARGLSDILDREVLSPGNLKNSLPAPTETDINPAEFKERVGKHRRIVLAASTHEGEEQFFLNAMSQSSDEQSSTDLLIIAPRHPERGDEVHTLISSYNLKSARWSMQDDLSPNHNVILADTMGEMGLWYRLADAVYLGGATAGNVGGHNPLEPLKLGKRVATGPHGYNFSGMIDELTRSGYIQIVKTPAELAIALNTMKPMKEFDLQQLEATSNTPMTETLSALSQLLEANR